MVVHHDWSLLETITRRSPGIANHGPHSATYSCFVNIITKLPLFKGLGEGEARPCSIFIKYVVAVIILAIACSVIGSGADGRGFGYPTSVFAYLNLRFAFGIGAITELRIINILLLIIYARYAVSLIHFAIAIIINLIRTLFKYWIDSTTNIQLKIVAAELFLLCAARGRISWFCENPDSRWAIRKFSDRLTCTNLGIVFYAITVIVFSIATYFQISTGWQIIVSSRACHYSGKQAANECYSRKKIVH